MPGAPSHGQNRGLAVGAADQAPRACDSAHGLTEKERAVLRFVALGSRVTSEPDPTTVSRSAPFIRSEPCVCRRVKGWDLEFESGLLQRGVSCEPGFLPIRARRNPLPSWRMPTSPCALGATESQRRCSAWRERCMQPRSLADDAATIADREVAVAFRKDRGKRPGAFLLRRPPILSEALRKYLCGRQLIPPVRLQPG